MTSTLPARSMAMRVAGSGTLHEHQPLPVRRGPPVILHRLVHDAVAAHVLDELPGAGADGLALGALLPGRLDVALGLDEGARREQPLVHLVAEHDERLLEVHGERVGVLDLHALDQPELRRQRVGGAVLGDGGEGELARPPRSARRAVVELHALAEVELPGAAAVQRPASARPAWGSARRSWGRGDRRFSYIGLRTTSSAPTYRCGSQRSLPKVATATVSVPSGLAAAGGGAVTSESTASARAIPSDRCMSGPPLPERPDVQFRAMGGGMLLRRPGEDNRLRGARRDPGGLLALHGPRGQPLNDEALRRGSRGWRWAPRRGRRRPSADPRCTGRPRPSSRA